MENKKEKNEILKVKKKYSVKYVLLYNLIEFHLVAIILLIALIASSRILTAIICLMLYFAILVLSMFLFKKSAATTHITFYDDKIVYVRKFLFINKHEEMKYDEIKEISFMNEPGMYARFWQKRTNMGNMTIYPKKGFILNGISINNIYPFDKIIEEVKNKIGEKIS